jgi:hypothetical protein
LTKPVFLRRRHDDAKRYVIYVLWLVGYPQRWIAAALNLRTKQVAGVIGNSEYRDRASMSDADRQAKLRELEAIRLDDAGAKLDGGALDRIPFKILPLDARQSRGTLKRRVSRRA